MRFFLAMLFPLLLFGGSYKAVIEPYDKMTLKSEVSGRIVKLDLKDEMRVVNKKLIEIDHYLESEKLKNYTKKLDILNKEIALKRGQYNRIKNLRGENRFTKERYESELLNLLMQRSDLLNMIAELKDRISKKNIYVKNLYVKKLYVREGEFVGVGAKLADLEDQRGSRLVLFISLKDRENIKNSKILINGKEDSGFVIDKIGDSPDSKYISSYRLELVNLKKLPYGKLVDVEIVKK